MSPAPCSWKRGHIAELMRTNRNTKGAQPAGRAPANLTMKTNIAELYKTDPVRACRLALRRTAHLPERASGANEGRIDEIDRLLGNSGVEAIRGDWQNGYWCDIVAVYSNAGDCYAVTVIQVRGDWQGARSRFIVGTVGDFVERNEKRYGLQ